MIPAFRTRPAAILALAVCAPLRAKASSPLEYPDNGAAAFARSGAWLAVANEPIATHYNPAALATQATSFSVEQQLNLNRVCYAPRGADGAPGGPAPGLEYLPVCNERRGFPSTIPSISVSWRATSRLGVGFAIVPPAAYGLPRGSLPATTLGINRTREACLAMGNNPDVCEGATPFQDVPAPYRYQLLEQRSTVFFPTLGAGYEVLPGLRVGAAFVAGIAVVNSTATSVTVAPQENAADNARNNSLSTLRTRDLFVPGFILSAHWSLTRQLDAAAWGRWLDPIEAEGGDLVSVTRPFSDDLSTRQPSCVVTDPDCDTSGDTNAVENRFGDETVRRFRFPFPPEARVGLRYHLPRSGVRASRAAEVRDPLKDDAFDVELDASYAWNERANTIEIRFAELDGMGVSTVRPTGTVPPNADRYNGYRDSYGVRVGGQVNLVRNRFGIRAGAWFESQSQEAEWLQVGVVGALRGGFGGGVVLRQGFMDISLGYQRHWSLGLDNHGRGAMRAVIASNTADLDNEPPDVSAGHRREFRTDFAVNNGRVTQEADAFSLGGTFRF